jgi:hypothetical protein
MIPHKEIPEPDTEGYEGIKATIDAENEANKAKNDALAKI